MWKITFLQESIVDSKSDAILKETIIVPMVFFLDWLVCSCLMSNYGLNHRIYGPLYPLKKHSFTV